MNHFAGSNPSHNVTQYAREGMQILELGPARHKHHDPEGPTGEPLLVLHLAIRR